MSQRTTNVISSKISHNLPRDQVTVYDTLPREIVDDLKKRFDRGVTCCTLFAGDIVKHYYRSSCGTIFNESFEPVVIFEDVIASDTVALDDASAAMKKEVLRKGDLKVNLRKDKNLKNFNGSTWSPDPVSFKGNEKSLPRTKNSVCRCGKDGSKKCSKCFTVFYCSRECQLTDWKNHKNNCKDFVEMRTRPSRVDEVD